MGALCGSMFSKSKAFQTPFKPASLSCRSGVATPIVPVNPVTSWHFCPSRFRSCIRSTKWKKSYLLPNIQSPAKEKVRSVSTRMQIDNGAEATERSTESAENQDGGRKDSRVLKAKHGAGSDPGDVTMTQMPQKAKKKSHHAK